MKTMHRGPVAPLPIIGYRKNGAPIYPIAGGDGNTPGNPVLARLLDERQSQVDLMDGILSQVQTEGRDMVESERNNLKAIKERIAQIDEQVKPLQEFEELRSAGVEATRNHRPTPAAKERGQEHRGGAMGYTQPRPHEYRTAGEFIVDLIRARGVTEQNIAADPEAAERVAAHAATRAHQTTAQTPGLLPVNIVGDILTDIDGSRPFIASLGAPKNLAGIPGKVFHRPHVTQHTTTGKQSAEKAELPSRQFKVDGIPFTKETFGGWLNVSRQEIDWTSPSAWDAIITDLQMEYGGDTDDWAAGEFEAAVEQSVPVADPDDLKAWVRALYAAARTAATAGGTKKARALRLPNHIWVSIDQWETIGAVIDSLAATQQTRRDPGSSSPTAFSGSILDIPRTVVPGFEEGTVIVGRTNLVEFYEERIGLLSAVEPKVLGVEVAYGGYAAFGELDATAFARVEAESESA